MNIQRKRDKFVAGSLGLDFLNSDIVLESGEVDAINDGRGLLQWVEQAGFIPPADLEKLRRQTSIEELDDVAGKVRALRMWFRQFVLAKMGQPLVESDVDLLGALNQLLENDKRICTMVVDDSAGQLKPEVRIQRFWNKPDELLLAIAEQLAKLVCEEDFTNVKQCQGNGCPVLFVDHTHGRVRRWCSMSICGNRAKVVGHRKRRSADSEDT